MTIQKGLEFSAKLFRKFPELFKDKDDPMKSLMCFGVECDEGWYNIIYKLTNEIYNLCKENNHFIQVLQVKEKFGGLRYYTSGIPKSFASKISKLIENAENQSFKTCEKCGKKGELRTDIGWYLTLCNKCYTIKIKEINAMLKRRKNDIKNGR